MRRGLRFKLGSIEGSKKSSFGPYVTPPKRLRIFDFLVRDQEVGGSNPLAPTTFKSRCHIDLLRNCFRDCYFKNLSRLVQQRVVLVFWKHDTKSNLGRTLLPPSDVI
jgi:hypothetical protein